MQFSIRNLRFVVIGASIFFVSLQIVVAANFSRFIAHASESSPATVPFSDSFGSSTSNEVTNWDEDDIVTADPTAIVAGAGSRPGSPTAGRARIASSQSEDGWIRRTIDATGFESLVLTYYWQGDSQANDGDQGIVEYCIGASCDSGWANLANHDLTSTDWSFQEIINLPSSLNDSIFRIRFQNASGSVSQHFRVDDVEVLGTEIEEEEDTTPPISTITSPQEDQRYIEDVWDGEIRGTASDSPSSGVATVFVSIQRDSDDLYWDGEGWSTGEGEDEILNEADFSDEDSSFSYDFDFIEPEGTDEGYTARSHAEDNAGNFEDTNEVHFFFGRAPIISDETESTVSTSSVTITWTTDHSATSRVIYDTVSHPVLGDPPKYGYSSSTAEFDTDPKVTSHSVAVDGLTAGTTYSYRTVSHGSPEAVGDEKSFTTTSPAAAAAASSPGPGDDGGGGAAPTCGNAKPGSAPTLTGASAGTNSVTLTWSEAFDPVTYYLVTYGTSPGAQQFGNPNVGGKGTTNYTVSGLSGGVTYYFKVRAGNGCAPGDFSNELSATPGGGFVAGPAAGFAPGVLGAATAEATPSAKATPETKGVQEEAPIKEGFLGSKVKYAVAAVIIFLIAGLILWRNRKTDKSKPSI